MDFIQKNKKILALVVAIAVIPIIASLLISRLPLLKQALRPPTTPPPSPPPVQIQPPQSTPKDASLQKGPFTCPSKAEFCQKGGEILRNGQYVGFGTTISPNSPIIAAFDGQIDAVFSTLPAEYNNETIITLYLDNKERGLRAVYYYQGTKAPTAATVEAGEVIDTVGKVMSFYNASLVFTLIKNDPVNGQAEKLTAKDFVIPKL